MILSAIFVCLCVSFIFKEIFKIRNIIIEGKTRYNYEEILAASTLKKNENLLFFSEDTIKEKVTTSLPFVENIKISRNFPGKITLEIKEAKPWATVDFNKLKVLLNTSFKVLDLGQTIEENLTKAEGIEILNPKPGYKVNFEDLKKEETLKTLIASLKTNNLEKITTIDLKDENQIFFLYDNRIKVILGNAEKLENKLQTAQIILEEQLTEESGELDLKWFLKNGESLFRKNRT